MRAGCRGMAARFVLSGWAGLGVGGNEGGFGGAVAAGDGGFAAEGRGFINNGPAGGDVEHGHFAGDEVPFQRGVGVGGQGRAEDINGLAGDEGEVKAIGVAIEWGGDIAEEGAHFGVEAVVKLAQGGVFVNFEPEDTEVHAVLFVFVEAHAIEREGDGVEGGGELVEVVFHRAEVGTVEGLFDRDVGGERSRTGHQLEVVE